MSRSSEALSQDYTMASAEMQELLLTFGGQSLTSQRLRPALLACTRPLGLLAFLALGISASVFISDLREHDSSSQLSEWHFHGS